MVKNYLMVPGPTTVPERVLQAMQRPVINHRGQQYETMLRDITAGLKRLFNTRHDVLAFPAAGTGTMEAAIVNLLSPGDKVLVVSVGVFGDRFAEIAARFGAAVEKLDFAWGEAACPQKLAARLAADAGHEIKAVFITQNETSTGVVNDIKALAAARGSHPALFIVDTVSSLGATEFFMDEWGIDAACAGSQKALMIPPGLAFLAMNERAWAACEKSAMPKFYWDAQAAKKSLAKWQNPYTPPVSLLFGLAEALKMIEEEGAANIFARHRLIAKALRAGLRAMGLRLLAGDAAASAGVTAVCAPEGIAVKDIRKVMRERYGITLAGGQKKLEDKIFRIGHLGYVAVTDILVTLSALEMALTELGMSLELGAGVRAAQQVILGEYRAKP
ncbi:MAG: alanine--glyoxylate aminotransferase family protein [Negativicutes bacterium]|nr:alanine--glyoxylate aminotransferase family protein [Negativicutes bacterium]